MNPLNVSPGVYLATSDALTVIGQSARISLRLNSDEIHCICYFSRALSASLATSSELDERGSYLFTYGERGGPFSADLQTALDSLVANGFVFRRPIAIDSPLYLEEYLADESALDFAATLQAGIEDPSNCASFIVATVRCFLVRPVPLVYNAIHREPSLYEARVQEMRIGLPLPTRNEVLREWLHRVTEAIDQEVPGRGSDPSLLVPVVVDALAAAAPPSSAEADHEAEPEAESGTATEVGDATDAT